MRIGEPYLKRNFPFKIDVSGGEFKDAETVDISGTSVVIHLEYQESNG